MKKRLLVPASANRDLIVTMQRMPAPGETFRAQSYGYAAGGKGSNAAVALARQGAQVTIATCLGNDDNGRALYQTYQKEGLDTRAVRFCDDAQTGFAICTVERDGNSRIIVIPGANEQIDFSAISPEILAEPFDGLMLQLEIPFDAVVQACRWAKKRCVPVIIDAGPASCDLALDQLCGVTIFSPNETETQILTGGMPLETQQDWEQAARALAERTGAEHIVLKLGARGAYIFNDSVSLFVPSFPVEAVDPTAAGDSFTAALALDYITHGDIVRAVRRANAAGALATLTVGAQPSLPDSDSIDAFLCQNA